MLKLPNSGLFSICERPSKILTCKAFYIRCQITTSGTTYRKITDNLGVASKNVLFVNNNLPQNRVKQNLEASVFV